jgi:peptide/nickel transport system permease protein
MLIYTLKRFGLAILVTFTVSMITFSLIYMAGDPAAAMAGETASDSDIAYLNELYGFDRPLPVQYAEWVSRALQGDLGQSLYFKLPVSELLFDRLPVSMTLGICSIIFAILLAIPLGVAAAMRPNSWIDRVALTVSVCGQALPSFWFALLLIVAFAVTFPIFPITGADTPMHFVLPTIVLGYFATPAIMRLTRAGMLEVLSSDYIRTARAKGLSPRVVLFKHALRNAIIPVVSLAAVQFGFMLGGSIVVESIFALHGAGYLAWESIGRHDLPVVQAIVLVFSLLYIILTFLADLLNAWLDPRIRVG